MASSPMVKENLDVGAIGGIINSLLSVVLSSLESVGGATSATSATSVALGMTSGIPSTSLTQSASPIAKSTSSTIPSPISQASLAQLSSTTLPSTSPIFTSSLKPTALVLTSSPASRSSSSASAPSRGASNSPARLSTSKILIIVISAVVGGVFLLLLLFVFLRRRQMNRLQGSANDDSETDSAGRKDLAEKPERYQSSVKDEPVVQPHRFSSLSRRLWQDHPKRPLTPVWGPLPTFPDSASMMTVVSHERQFTPRSGMVSRDRLGSENDGTDQGARPWNLQRGYSDPMLNRPTGRAIEIAPVDTYRPPEGETEDEEESGAEDEEEDVQEREIISQRARAEVEEEPERKGMEESSVRSANSSVLGYYSRSLREPHQSTPELSEPSSLSHPSSCGIKSLSSSQPILDPYGTKPVKVHSNRRTPSGTSLDSPLVPTEFASRHGLNLKVQTHSTASSRQKSGFALDGSITLIN